MQYRRLFFVIYQMYNSFFNLHNMILPQELIFEYANTLYVILNAVKNLRFIIFCFQDSSSQAPQNDNLMTICSRIIV